MVSKKRILAVVLTLIPVLVLMLTIFGFSAQDAALSDRSSGRIVKWVVALLYPHIQSLAEEEQAAVVHIITLLVRKGAHLTEYLLLGAALTVHIKAISACRPVLFGHRLAFGIGTLYAISDEIHQVFISGRSGEVRDILLDSFGVLLGVLLIRLLAWLRDRRRGSLQSAK